MGDAMVLRAIVFRARKGIRFVVEPAWGPQVVVGR